MKVAEKYANQKFGGMNTMTMTNGQWCKHRNGWYVTVSFWIFRKRIFVCSDCGHHQDQVPRFCGAERLN
jgi:hypothetical protein